MIIEYDQTDARSVATALERATCRAPDALCNLLTDAANLLRCQQEELAARPILTITARGRAAVSRCIPLWLARQGCVLAATLLRLYR